MKELIGKKIVEVRQMTDEEVEYEGWPGAGDDTVLVLDDGTRVYASCDPEGNMPGALFTRAKDEPVYHGTVYLTLDEDDLHGSLEYVEIVAAEAHEMYDRKEIEVESVERDSISFVTSDESVARQYGHFFVEMTLGAGEPVPTPWAREHAARVACVEKVGVIEANRIQAEHYGIENEVKRAEMYEAAAKAVQ
jgi:hypothetical protein